MELDRAVLDELTLEVLEPVAVAVGGRRSEKPVAVGQVDESVAVHEREERVDDLAEEDRVGALLGGFRVVLAPPFRELAVSAIADRLPSTVPVLDDRVPVHDDMGLGVDVEAACFEHSSDALTDEVSSRGAFVGGQSLESNVYVRRERDGSLD